MKTRNFAFALGLLASASAFAETTNGSSASGTVTGAPAGGSANSPSMGNATTPGNTSSVFGNSSSDITSGPTVGNTMMNSGALNSRQSVLDAQRSLVNQGFSISVDGVSGPQTESAVRQFQARNGLPETGVLDTRTQQALSTSSSAQPSASDTSAQ